ncbi:hypothetical protein [Puniceicoccus vermicola]|uniref:AbiV family abortive infection protein n=1 Tax=Puniceicoccus vermicola TaxID=388746 RepID=A0A7X1AWY7_9BACT|nr:hypothetical protein [Puniceicoccus vermicola]MBC2600568.1 hypothetical protein [Puniceicoccus vermicola]
MNLREIEAHTKEIGETLLYCLENKKRLPTMILIYTAIDMLASLTRPIDQEDTNGLIYKDWVEKYLIDEIEVDVAAEDIWGARCGVLHTNQPDSRKSRSGLARRLEYYQGPKEHIDMLQSKIDPDRKKHIILNLEQLSEAFLSAIVLFFKDVNSDPELMKRLKHHGDKIFVRSSMEFPRDGI